MPFFKKKKEGPEALDAGWQFYSRPTTMDPPGTVFRVDKEGVKYPVHRLGLAIEEGKEAEIHLESEIETTASILTRFFGLRSFDVKAGAGRVKRLKFSMSEPVREVTTDYTVSKSMGLFLKEMPYKAGNRYFLIRAARTATAMKYLLSQELAADLGGEVAITEAIKAGAKIKAGTQGIVEIDQKFEERMRVMFLPEEIMPVRAGLSSKQPELGLRPVSEVLIWEEG